MTSNKPLKIGLFSLILLITVSIDSIRNLPSTALFGSTLIFLYLISSLFMLIPGSIAASEFAYGWPEKGGIFQWVSLGLGTRLGFLAVWGQWINTLVWFPTILSFVAASIAYIVHPAWANNSHYMVFATLICFWSLTGLALFGFKVSARVAAFCSFFGLILPMGFIIVLVLIWIFSGKHLQIPLNMHSMLPNFHSMKDWFSLVAIMTSFEGFELVAVHMSSIKNPKKNYPRAMFASVILILCTMILGSLAIAVIIPNKEITLVGGVAQGFSGFLAAYHLSYLLPVLIILMTLGNLGEMINWLEAPARGLFQASSAGFLPQKLHRQNRFGAEKNVLILQGLIISCVSLIFLLLPSINSAYWFLTNLSVEIYMLVYFLMFLAAIAVEFHYPKREHLYGTLNHRPIILFIYALGIVGCLVTLVIGAFPPTNINIGSTSKYQLYFWLGMFLCFIPILPIYYFHYGAPRLKLLSLKNIRLR